LITKVKGTSLRCYKSLMFVSSKPKLPSTS